MEPITNEEKYLAALTGESVVLPEPFTTTQMFMARAAGMDVNPPAPFTNDQMYWAKIIERIESGDGSGVVIRNQNKTITENGSYKADSGYTGLGTVTVAVPDPILKSLTVTENGAYTPSAGVDGFSKVLVDVAASSGIPAPITAIAAGSITPTSDIAEFTLPHNLGVVPKIVIVCLDNMYRADDNGGAIFSYMVNYMVAVGDGLNNKNTQALIQYIHPTSFNKLSLTSNGNTITETTAEIKGGSDTAMFKATVIDENGETIPAVYNWVAMAF